MKVYLNNVSRVSDAIITMYMSKRSWTPEINEDIIETCDRVFDKRGFYEPLTKKEDTDKVTDWLNKLFKWGRMHTTMLRFIDVSFTVEGLHRGAQDDFDSHAKRLDNRIVRSSTRLADFGSSEKSDYYSEKILTLDEALSELNISVPGILTHNGRTYIRTTNGYIDSDYVNNKDVKRGLYMLSIPSNFIFKCNLTELAHIIKERDCNSNAAPELKEMIEDICEQLHNIFPQLTKDYWYSVLN
jgi:thymidylate synthase ThyX